MELLVPTNEDGWPAAMKRFGDRVQRWNDAVRRSAVQFDARMRILEAEPEEGAATAEYAVVLVAATGFAAVLVALLKSDTVKALLTNIIQNALNVG